MPDHATRSPQPNAPVAGRRLILVKHSLPAIEPNVAAAQWSLCDEGRRRCDALATAIAPNRPSVVIASVEPKATETAALVADRLALPLEPTPDLHEHDRRTVPWQPTEAFDAAVARFFAEPDRLVFGRETARAATRRFGRAVDAALARHPQETIAILAHGTVISLLVAERAGAVPLPLWRRFGLPSFVACSLPDSRIVAVVEKIDEPIDAPLTEP